MPINVHWRMKESFIPNSSQQARLHPDGATLSFSSEQVVVVCANGFLIMLQANRYYHIVDRRLFDLP